MAQRNIMVYPSGLRASNHGAARRRVPSFQQELGALRRLPGSCLSDEHGRLVLLDELQQVLARGVARQLMALRQDVEVPHSQLGTWGQPVSRLVPFLARCWPKFAGILLTKSEEKQVEKQVR